MADEPKSDVPSGSSSPAAKPSDTRLSASGGPPPRRAQGRRRIIVIVVLVVLVVGGVLLWRYFSTYESTDDAQVDVHLFPVSARISGYVVKVNVGDNEYVQKGAVLVEIDPTDYQVALAQAQADLKSAQATASSLNITVPITDTNTQSQLTSTSSDIVNADAGIAAAQQQLAAATQQVAAAQATDVKAQDDLKRYKLLVDKQEVAEQVYDQALATAKSSTASVAAAQANESAAEAAVKQAEARLVQSKANHAYALTGPQQVRSTRDRVQAALADVMQKQAVVDQAQLNLQYTKIIAPVTGLVNKTVVEGLNVQPGQQLLTVVPLDQIWITANFKETQMKKMRVGQAVDIKVDANGRKYKGHVNSIAGATGPLFSLLPPENATGNYVKVVQRIPVKITLDPGENQDLYLRPGMSVEPDVYLQ